MEEDLEGIGVLGALGALFLVVFSRFERDSCIEDGKFRLGAELKWLVFGYYQQKSFWDW